MVEVVTRKPRRPDARPPSRVRRYIVEAVAVIDTPAARAEDAQAELDVELDELLAAQLRLPVDPLVYRTSLKSLGRNPCDVAEVGCPPQRADRESGCDASGRQRPARSAEPRRIEGISGECGADVIVRGADRTYVRSCIPDGDPTNGSETP